MKYSHRFPHGLRATASAIVATLIYSTTLLSNANANPTLVVDIDTGAMQIHVGDTGPLPKSVVGCSKAGGGCSTSLTPGNWGPIDTLTITSPASGLNGANGPDVLLQMVAPSNVNNHSESNGFGGGTSSFIEGTIFDLTPTYNTSLDTQDIEFTSFENFNPTDWNTIYIGVPEPSTIVLLSLGIIGLASRKRRHP